MAKREEANSSSVFILFKDAPRVRGAEPPPLDLRKEKRERKRQTERESDHINILLDI